MAARLGISEVLCNHPFGTINTSLRKSPFNSSKFNLCFLCFLGLAADSKIIQLDAGLLITISIREKDMVKGGKDNLLVDRC